MSITLYTAMSHKMLVEVVLEAERIIIARSNARGAWEALHKEEKAAHERTKQSLSIVTASRDACMLRLETRTAAALRRRQEEGP
jgi:hypothetical protein